MSFLLNMVETVQPYFVVILKYRCFFCFPSKIEARSTHLKLHSLIITLHSFQDLYKRATVQPPLLAPSSYQLVSAIFLKMLELAGLKKEKHKSTNQVYSHLVAIHLATIPSMKYSILAKDALFAS